MSKKFLLSAGVALGLLFGINITNIHAADTQITAQQVVDKMQIGWNLGNSLDAYNYSKGFHFNTEDDWNNPITTKKMIDTIAAAGFRSIRIPVTYYNHLDANKQIDPAWLDRVEEVVNYALDNDLYVVMNVHHDTGHDGWIRSEVATYERDSAELVNLWSQIATRFKDYDHRLLFEGTNEILNSDQNWDWEDSWDDFRITHKLNQDFIKTVRNTGGKNSNRFLVISTWAAAWMDPQVEELFYKDFNDTATDRLIMSVHSYDTNPDTIYYHINSLSQLSQQHNIPIIIDEFGTEGNMSEADRITITDYFVRIAKQYGMTCFVWDNGSTYGLLDRYKCCFNYPNIVKTMIQAAGGTYTPQTFDKVETFSFSDPNNWRSGHYGNTYGNYQSYEGRVCLNDYVTVDKETYTVTAPSNYQILIREFSKRGSFLRTVSVANGEEYIIGDNTSFIGITLCHAQGENVSFDTYMTLLSNGQFAFEKKYKSRFLNKLTSTDRSVWFTDYEVAVNNYSKIQVTGTLKDNQYYDILNAGNGNYIFRMEKNSGLSRRVSWWNNKVADATASSHIDITQDGLKTYAIIDDVYYEENLMPGNDFCATGIKINLSNFQFEGASVTDENGVLLKDYVPALNEEGQVCIYEKVSGTYLSLPNKNYTYE